ncbi:MAG: phosphonate transport system permease protein [Clostridium sp.]|jgi:phosphonate transport system permease protein
MYRLKGTLNYHKKGILTLILSLIFIWSLFSVNWGSELMHTGGKSTFMQIIYALLHPSITGEIIKLGFKSAGITLAYAVAGMTLAFIFAVVFGTLASGILAENELSRKTSKGIFRGILGFMRAIHELVWAFLFVASVGLTPFAAIFALAIPYGGSLGKIYADILNDVPSEPIRALRASGASKLQLIIYGYLPMAKVDMISYTMYRFECAIRSSTIMSFVGLGGLGFQIQLSLQDLNYSEVWTFMFFLTALVVLIDSWSNSFRNAFLTIGTKVKKFNVVKFSYFLSMILIIGSWMFIFVIDKADFFGMFTEKNLMFTKKFIIRLLGINEVSPAFLNKESLINALKLTYETLQMGIMAIGFATIAMLLTVIPAARNVADGTITLKKRWYRWLIFGAIRSAYIFSRAVPELVWAMIIVFILKPGILPGALALGIHNFGILGKLCSEVIEDLEMRPVRNLASCGANSHQMFFYGVIPMVMPKFITYILYRGEVILRTTITVGFVGAGGLGQQFKLSMSYFKYTEITLILICYILLVVLAELLSGFARKLSD